MCIYIKVTDKEYVTTCLYVNDMLIGGSSDETIKTTKKTLNMQFNMKDMGVANVILGIKITRTHVG